MFVAISRIDGGVSIMNIFSDSDVTTEIDKWKEAHVNEYASHQIIDGGLLPKDRIFRNAWKLESNIIKHDITKAKEIKKQQLRNLRKPLLEKLDTDYLRALEKGTSTDQIVLAKQQLRDVTTLALPDSIEELVSFIPDILQ